MDCHQHFEMSAKTEGHTTNSKFQSSSSPDGISGLQGDFLLMLLLDATESAADSLEQAAPLLPYFSMLFGVRFRRSLLFHHHDDTGLVIYYSLLLL